MHFVQTLIKGYDKHISGLTPRIGIRKQIFRIILYRDNCFFIAIFVITFYYIF